LKTDNYMNNSLIRKLRKEVNREIITTIRSFCEIPIASQMLGYQMGLLKNESKETQGKRFRPILCLLSSLAINGDYKMALPAAAAIELIHNFSLIHDDIQDEDECRRGRKTVWRKWGNNQAINAGDAMHTLANIALQRLFKMNLSPKVIDSVFFIINNACYQMCEGQMLDIGFEKKWNVRLPQYLQMIRKKTATLIQSAPYCGALIATQNRSVIRHYKNFGANVGMAFQIFNDLSGCDGSAAQFNHFYSDLIKKKKTLPVILAFKSLESAQKRKIKEREMLSLFKESDAIQHSRRIGENYLENALLELNKTGIKNPSQELLKEYIKKGTGYFSQGI